MQLILRGDVAAQDDFVETVKPNARQTMPHATPYGSNLKMSHVASSQLKTRTFSIPAGSYHSNMAPLHPE